MPSSRGSSARDFKGVRLSAEGAWLRGQEGAGLGILARLSHYWVLFGRAVPGPQIPDRGGQSVGQPGRQGRVCCITTIYVVLL